MFEEWKFHREIRRMQEAKNKDSEKYYTLYSDAVEDGTPPNEIRKINAEGDKKNQLHEVKINIYMTRYLGTLAVSLLVPMPPVDREEQIYWMNNPVHGGYVLTPNGVKQVRDGIHEEIKKRWERRFIWVQPLSALLSFLIALGGVVAACLSLWYKKP